ncbi:hypothetical protein O181_105885 [Austropuccinia psidii MF-1]|uniref:Uncharacterized protein n=1 Tax=Austropuccinia psidii MF-1 TaxID=1389203 RepID=A0A9Q3JRC5_9BASI|nr:hypothetical protein [Austropuccinia psidii MF-1]
MNLQHLIPSDRRVNAESQEPSWFQPSDPYQHIGSQDKNEDSARNSKGKDHGHHNEHGTVHNEFGDNMDHDHPSLYNEEEDDDMDENEMATLCASEALFGFDHV